MEALQATAFGKSFSGTSSGYEGLTGRRVEGAHEAVEEQDSIDRNGGMETVQGEREEQHRANGKGGVASAQDAEARDAIRRVTGQQKEADAGQELRESHQAKIERPVCQFIDLPANSNRLHFRRDGDDEAGQRIIAKIWIAKGGSRGGQGGRRLLHSGSNYVMTRRRKVRVPRKNIARTDTPRANKIQARPRVGKSWPLIGGTMA